MRAINASQDAAHAISAASNVTSIAILHFMRPHLLGLERLRQSSKPPH
jgi:hypothetical protein